MELILISCFNCKKVFNQNILQNKNIDCPFCYQKNVLSYKKIEVNNKNYYEYKSIKNPYQL